MDFTDVIKDLVKMEGLCLQSIRPGAEIVIEKVDIDQKKITIRNSAGKIQNRYFAELERIWNALLSNAAIRVEEVLNGSGSSRNQPETIFANLPYVEWLRINNKKHISYVGRATHAYGTICQMNSVLSESVMRSLQRPTENDLNHVTLIITENILMCTNDFLKITGKTATALSEGVYSFSLNDQTIIIASSEKIGIPCGTYIEMVTTHKIPSAKKIKLADIEWDVLCMQHINVLIRQKKIRI